MKKNLLKHSIYMIAACIAIGTSAIAGESIWTAKLVHYGEDKDEWAIYLATDPIKPSQLSELLKNIFNQDQNARIHHIALGKLFAREDIQTEVVNYLQKQELFQSSPPPFGLNQWNYKGSGEIHKLVSDALLQSKFVASLNQELAMYHRKIMSAGIEKLFFTKEDGKIKWHGIVSFDVKPVSTTSSPSTNSAP